MKSRSCKLAVEVLEDRCVPATVAYGDFNNDGLMDMAAVTAPTTVTVSLAKPDGTYTVSAVLSAPPKSPPISSLSVHDYDGDGDQDLSASSPSKGDWVYTHKWLGNGDGTFDFNTTDRWRWPPKVGHGGTW